MSAMYIIVFWGHRSDGRVDVMEDEVGVVVYESPEEAREALRDHLLEVYGGVLEVVS